MSGSGRLFIQPSELTFFDTDDNGGDAYPPGMWHRGIPTPGVALLLDIPVPAVRGIADCHNLVSNSPPTLLEAFELYSYSIGWKVHIVQQAGDYVAPFPNLSAELGILVNDELRYVSTETVPTGEEFTGAGTAAASGSWSADLVNPILVGARDRLTLRIGVSADQTAGAFYVLVGAQSHFVSAGGAGNVMDPFESTISYNQIDLPARRRL